MKRISLACLLAVMTMICLPAHAGYIGTLPNDQEWTLTVQNNSVDRSAITVYYVDKRGLDVIETLTVEAGVSVSRTLPKPGGRVSRVIIEVGPPAGGRATITVNQFSSVNCDADANLVFDVV